MNIREITAPAAGNQYLFPGRSARSRTATRRPRLPASIAHISPAAPAPRTTTSYLWIMSRSFRDHRNRPGVEAFQSGTFSRGHATSPPPMRLKWRYAAQNILDLLHSPGPHRRYGASSRVGAGRDDSHRLRMLVVRLPQRLVLVRFSRALRPHKLPQLSEQ